MKPQSNIRMIQSAKNFAITARPQWLTWLDLVIARAKVKLSSKVFCDIHMWAISQKSTYDLDT